MGRLHPSAVLLTALLLAGACAGGASTTQEGGSGASRDLIEKPAAPKAAAGYSDPTPDFTRDLLAGDGSAAGFLTVRNDAETLYIEFSVSGPAGISAAHVYTGAEAPAEDADPAGFAGQAALAEPAAQCSVALPLAGLEPGRRAFLAACVESGGERLWARGDPAGTDWLTPLPAPSLAEMSLAPPQVSPVVQTTSGPPQAVSTEALDWAAEQSGVRSFEYTVMPVFAPVVEWRTYLASNNHPWGTWGADFTSGAGLPFEDEGVFTGWCVDRAHSMYTGQPYEIQLWSCYDPELPDFAQSDNYDLISYLITQRNNNSSYPWNVNWGTLAGRIAFQDAVWYFMGGGGMPGEGSLGNRIVKDALAQGEGFVPGPGEYYAAVLYPRTTTNDPNERAQENVIEVEVPDHTI